MVSVHHHQDCTECLSSESKHCPWAALQSPQDMHAGKFKCEENDFAQTIIKSSLFICKTCSTLLCFVCSREDLHLKAASNPTESQPDTPSIKSNLPFITTQSKGNCLRNSQK